MRCKAREVTVSHGTVGNRRPYDGPRERALHRLRRDGGLRRRCPPAAHPASRAWCPLRAAGRARIARRRRAAARRGLGRRCPRPDARLAPGRGLPVAHPARTRAGGAQGLPPGQHCRRLLTGRRGRRRRRLAVRGAGRDGARGDDARGPAGRERGGTRPLDQHAVRRLRLAPRAVGEGPARGAAADRRGASGARAHRPGSTRRHPALAGHAGAAAPLPRATVVAARARAVPVRAAGRRARDVAPAPRRSRRGARGRPVGGDPAARAGGAAAGPCADGAHPGPSDHPGTLPGPPVPPPPPPPLHPPARSAANPCSTRR